MLHQGAPNGGAISSGCDRYVSLTVRETFNGGMVSNVFSCNLHSVQSRERLAYALPFVAASLEMIKNGFGSVSCWQVH